MASKISSSFRFYPNNSKNTRCDTLSPKLFFQLQSTWTISSSLPLESVDWDDLATSWEQPTPCLQQDSHLITMGGKQKKGGQREGVDRLSIEGPSRDYLLIYYQTPKRVCVREIERGRGRERNGGGEKQKKECAYKCCVFYLIKNTFWCQILTGLLWGCVGLWTPIASWTISSKFEVKTPFISYVLCVIHVQTSPCP